MTLLIPKLRFPEFLDKWELKNLNFICEKIKDGTHFSPFSADDGEFYYLTSKNVKNGFIDLSTAQFVSKVDHEKIYKSCDVKFGDVLLTKDGTIGQVCVNTLDFEFSLLSSVAYLRVKNDYNNYFLYQLLTSELGQTEINKAIAGQALKRITLTKINDFEFTFPKLPEQTKIANFLTAVDGKIHALKEKKRLLESYKKGLMQQIFSQEIRFKQDDGTDFPDWEEKTLGEICEFENGKGHENEIEEFGPFIVVNSKFVSSNGITKKYTNKALSPLKKDDIVMVMSDVPNGKALAKCFYIDNDNLYTLNQRICSIRAINAVTKFLFYQINRNPYYLAFDSGVGQTNLKKNEVLDCPIFYPPNLIEQYKIANFLTSIDEKIEKLGQQIDDAQIFKKGLLQQMFV